MGFERDSTIVVQYSMKKVLIFSYLAIFNLICFGQTTPNQQLRAVFSKVHRTINGVQALPSPFFLNMAVQSFSKDRFYKKIIRYS